MIMICNGLFSSKIPDVTVKFSEIDIKSRIGEIFGLFVKKRMEHI